MKTISKFALLCVCVCVCVAAPAPAKANAAKAAAPAKERDFIQHGEQEHEWAPKRFLAEFIGTFALCWGIYMTRATVKDVNGDGTPAGELVGVALVHAFVLTAMAASFGSVSGGHFNPAVTATFIITRQINWAVGLIYIVVQCAAAVLAGALTWGLLPETLTTVKPGTHWSAPISCGKFPDLDTAEATRFDGTCPYRAFGAEIFGTGFLLITIFMAGVAGYGLDSAYIAIGLSLGFGVLATGPISNACLNPARALGAAAFAHKYDWSHFWVWVVGPFIASIVVALIFGLVFQAPWGELLLLLLVLVCTLYSHTSSSSSSCV
jgi:glycerol uptake facilitator-like aquaporin